LTVFTNTWNAAFEASPPGTEDASSLDTRIQDLKEAVRERTEVEHYWAGDTEDGIHKFPYLAEAARDALTDNEGQIVISSDGSRISYRDDSGNWITLDTHQIGDIKMAAYGPTVAGAGQTAATFGWVLCDGSAVSRTVTYDALFAVIDTSFGVGDGSTTFNLPDMQGQVPVGVDTGNSDIAAVGDEHGSLTHTLTVDEMPAHDHTGSSVASDGAHNHDYNDPDDTSAGSTLDTSGSRETNSSNTSTDGAHTHGLTIASQGGGSAHENMQPSVAFNYYIKFK